MKKLLFLLLLSVSAFGQTSINLPARNTITRNTTSDSLKVGTSQVLDRDNPDNAAFYLRNNMKWLELALQNSSSTTGTNIVLLGDSKTDFGIIPASLQTALNDKVFSSGPGFIQVTSGNIKPQNTAASPASGAAGWTTKTFNTGGRGLNLYSIVSTVSSTAFGWVNQSAVNTYNTFTSLQVTYWGQAGGGSFEVRVDGVLKGTINTSLTTGVQNITYGSLTDAQHDVLITPLGANCEILGFKAFRSTLGTNFHSFGQSGAKASHYNAADTSTWNPQLRNLSPDLLIVYLGANNRLAAQTLSAFKTEMQTLVTRLKQAKSTMDICLMGQSDYQPGILSSSAIATTKQYNNVLRQLAIENSISYFDIDQLFGDYNASKGLLTDGLHEGTIAANLIAYNFWNGIPALGKYNLSENVRRTFGATGFVPINQTANRLLYSDATGTVTTSAALAYSGTAFTFTNTNATFTGTSNLTVGGSAYVGTVPLAVGTFRTAAPAVIGYFGFTTGQSLGAAGYKQGIRLDGDSQPVRFATSNQGAVTDNWLWENHAGVNRTVSQNNTNVMRFNLGVGLISGNSWGTNYLKFDFIIDQTGSTQTGNVFRGIYYAPTLTSLTGISRHIFLENTTGDVALNSTSGSTVVGSNTTATEKFEVYGNIALKTAGNKLLIKSGTNSSAGTSTLTAGAVTVATTAVTANSIVLLQRQSDGGTVGASYSIVKTAGTGFTITAKDGAGVSNTADTSTIGWVIIDAN
jgi:hypothetical protein